MSFCRFCLHSWHHHCLGGTCSCHCNAERIAAQPFSSYDPVAGAARILLAEKREDA